VVSRRAALHDDTYLAEKAMTLARDVGVHAFAHPDGTRPFTVTVNVGLAGRLHRTGHAAIVIACA
jgi:hypothetical protein